MFWLFWMRWVFPRLMSSAIPWARIPLFTLACIMLIAASLLPPSGGGWGSNPAERNASIKVCEDIAAMFENQPIEVAAASYARAPMRRTFEAKDPRGFAEFERMLADHSGKGAALTMLNPSNS